MAERFNVPPGWPVPSGWTPPQGWEPDPTWPAAPAGWQYWVEDVAASRPGTQSESAGKRLVVLGTVGAVVLAALTGAMLMFLHNRDNIGALKSSTVSGEVPDEAWKTLPSSAPTVLPAGAVQCGVTQSGTYRTAARGNDVTSCPFAESVRDALNGAGGQVPTSIDAYSPVTSKRYRMNCAMEQVITCRGGDNAVVYVYDRAAVTGAPAASAPVTNALPSDAMIFEALRRSAVSGEDVSRYAIVSRAAPKPGWYVVEIRRTDMPSLEHGWVILRDNDPPDGHLVTVAGPGTSFPGVSVPEEVRQALPQGMIPDAAPASVEPSLFTPWGGHGRSMDLRPDGTGTVEFFAGAGDGDKWNVTWTRAANGYVDIKVVSKISQIGSGSGITLGTRWQARSERIQGFGVLRMVRSGESFDDPDQGFLMCTRDAQMQSICGA